MTWREWFGIGAGSLLAVAVMYLVSVGTSFWPRLGSPMLQAAGEQSHHWTIGQTSQSGHVQVFELSGVCLYVVEDYYGHSESVAALSKATLPAGTGCQ